MIAQEVHHSADAWYLIHCNAKKEQYAANVLKENLGLLTFLPEYMTRTRGRIKRVPLLPNYLFAQIDFQKVPLSRNNISPYVDVDTLEKIS